MALLVGVAAWFGSRDSALDRTLDDHTERLERSEERIDLNERLNIEQAVTIETNRQSIEQNTRDLEEQKTAIEDLVAKGKAQAAALEALRDSLSDARERLAAAEGTLEEQAALREQIEQLGDKLATLERSAVDDARRIGEMRGQLDALERERQLDLERIERIERALGIDPPPAPAP